MTVKNIHQSVTHKMAAKASWHRDYVTVTLCIAVQLITRYADAHASCAKNVPFHCNGAFACETD